MSGRALLWKGRLCVPHLRKLGIRQQQVCHSLTSVHERQQSRALAAPPESSTRGSNARILYQAEKDAACSWKATCSTPQSAEEAARRAQQLLTPAGCIGCLVLFCYDPVRLGCLHEHPQGARGGDRGVLWLLASCLFCRLRRAAGCCPAAGSVPRRTQCPSVVASGRAKLEEPAAGHTSLLWGLG